MNSVVPVRNAPVAELIRATARLSSAILFVIWIGLFVTEWIQGRIREPSAGPLLQAATLAVIFAGYVIASRHELAGALLSIVGTLAFVLVDSFVLPIGPGLGAVSMFALPGVLYLLAWYMDRQKAKQFRG